MTRNKAERLHHRKRITEKVENFEWLQPQYWQNEEARLHHIRLRVETRAPCSCDMCGNARRIWKQKTIQEKRQDQYKDDE